MSRRIFIHWLRRTHLYLGLWGAVLGFFFGATGLVMNHRAVLKWPVEKTTQRTAQVPAPREGFATSEAMAGWLRTELGFEAHHVVAVRRHPAQTVVWAGRAVEQPERWTVNLQSPARGVLAEYYAGNRFVRLDHVDATLVGLLTRLHMSVGVSALWVLLADTIAGSFILLSLTGLLLWTQMNTVRLATAATSVTALGAAVLYLAA